MCTGFEGALLSTAIGAGGTILQQNAANDAAEKQQRIINQAAEETAKKNAQKVDLIQNHTSDVYNADNRLNSYENAAQQAETSLLDSVMKAGGEGGNDVSQSAEGRVSNEYLAGRAKATSDAASQIANKTRLMARQGALSKMFMDEGLKGGQLQSDVATINSSINGLNRKANDARKAVKNEGSLLGGLMIGSLQH